MSFKLYDTKTTESASHDDVIMDARTEMKCNWATNVFADKSAQNKLTHDEIDNQTEAFLKGGGKISRIEPDVYIKNPCVCNYMVV